MKLMGIINLTPDSFYVPSRYNYSMLERDVDIIDAGAVSTRPGAPDVDIEEEWHRLEQFLELWNERYGVNADCGRWMRDSARWNLHGDGPRELSIDTTSSEIVRRAYEIVGPFIVNDISAGHDDPKMLRTVGRLGLPYVAMHKRGNPRTMDSLADTGTDIIIQLKNYFHEFAIAAQHEGIEDWVLDPGLGFAKTAEQNIEIINRLEELQVFNRPILAGVGDKRFTHVPPSPDMSPDPNSGNYSSHYESLAAAHGANILRIH